MAKRNQPPIHSSDNKEITLGSTIYGVDRCGTGKVVALQVIDLDLGVRRMVRLRRSNGVEWLWSPNGGSQVCRNAHHSVFADKSNATAVVHQIRTERTKNEIKSAKKDAARERRHVEDYKQIMERHRKALKAAEGKVKKLERKLTELPQ